MKTISKEINIGDIIECLTNDGWEVGTVVKIENNTITVFMDYVQKKMNFTIEQINKIMEKIILESIEKICLSDELTKDKVDAIYNIVGKQLGRDKEN